MIRSIKLVNWKTHKNTYIEFQKGTNVIVGMMGAGKSSLMDAISFGLFGTFPSLEHKRHKVEDIIMNRPSVEQNATVELTFDVGQDIYKIMRSISRSKKTEARLEKNGAYLQTQSERVNEEISSILKINYEVFSRAIYAEQNGIDYFLELRKGDRKKQIDEMLGLDRFALAEENATSLINAIKALIKEDERAVESADASSIEKKISELNAELEANGTKMKSLESASKALLEETSKIKSDYQSMKAEYDKKTALSKELEAIKSKVDTLNSQLAKAERPKEDERNLQESLEKDEALLYEENKKLEALESSIKQAIRDRSGTEYKISSINKDIEEAARLKAIMGNDSIKSLSDRLSSATEELDKLKSGIASSKSTKQEIQKWLAALKEHMDKCPLCEQDIGEDLGKKLIKEREELISEEESLISEKSKELSIKETVIKGATSRLEEVKRAAAKLESLNASPELLSELQESLRSKDLGISSQEKAADEIKAKASETSAAIEAVRKSIDSAKRIKSIESEISSSKLLLEQKLSAYSGINVDEKEMDRLRESYTEKRSEYAKLSAESKALAEASTRLAGQVSENASTLDKIKSIEKRISERRKLSISMSKFKAALVETETSLRSRLVSSINSLLESLWLGLYPYGDYSGLMLNASSDDYSLDAAISIGPDEVWIPVDSVASGGERSIACLALRIALSMVIVPNLKWLILDEPTHNLDQQGITKMIEVFSNSLPSIVEQIFIITHDEELKQIHTAKVYEFERDKSANEPTKVKDVY